MRITVTLDVGERYDALVTNEISLELPGGVPKGAGLVKERLTGFVQDAMDVLIPKTISDLDEKISSLSLSADSAERDNDLTVDGASGSPLA